MAEFLNNISNRIGATVNNIAGNIIGNITGLPSEDIPLYEDFLYDILSDADGAVSEPSYWVVFFTEGADANPNTTIQSSVSSIINSAIGSYISQFNIGKTNIGDLSSKELSSKIGYKMSSSKPIDVQKWTFNSKAINAEKSFWDNTKRSMMLVQGIEIPGDGFSISREGAENIGGFLRPPITGIRNDLPEMAITFLENNTSVTDMVLRPWVIESSYASLKFAKKCTVTCYNLTRSPSGFRIRKQFDFYNAVPIEIDAERYEYSSGKFGLRQTKFVFTHYTIHEGDQVRDSLIGSIANNILQTTRKFVTGVVESGVDVIGGGANQVFTNITGAFTDNVNKHLQDVQKKVREYAQEAEDSIIDKSQRLIDKAFGFDPEKDNIQHGGKDFSRAGVENNPSPRVPVNVSSSDSRTTSPIPPKSSGVQNNVKYIIREINTDDTVDSNTLKFQEVKLNNSGE